jgi:hypothetical protein
MRQHQIDDSDVRSCIDEAQRQEPSIEGRINYYCPFRDRELRITVVHENGELVVITVTLRDVRGGGPA